MTTTHNSILKPTAESAQWERYLDNLDPSRQSLKGKAGWFDKDTFEPMRPKRLAASALGGFIAAGVGGLPLGCVHGAMANIIMNGAALFAPEEDKYFTVQAKETQDACTVATLALCFATLPIVGVLESAVRESAKPYKQPLAVTTAQFYLAAVSGALVGVGIGTLTGLSLQKAFGTDSQIGYDLARILGASVGSAALVKAYLLGYFSDA